MEFRIADTFTDSLARLTGDEQKAVKTTAFDLQLNPADPGMRFHKLDKAKDKNFWSVRVGSDIRLIVHKTKASLLLATSITTTRLTPGPSGASWRPTPRPARRSWSRFARRSRKSSFPHYVEGESVQAGRNAEATLSPNLSDDDLLGYGVPAEWLERCSIGQRGYTSHAGRPSARRSRGSAAGTGDGRHARECRNLPWPRANPFDHPDAQRRFRVMANVEELERALDFPWEKWTVFLHPEQRQWVERDYTGPARVSGSAGTGKTIVALHRAVHLARTNPDARVLLTTFSDTLANALQTSSGDW